MSEPTNGGPAFPQIESDAEEWRESNKPWSHTYSYGGMSLRDYFAAKAMAAAMCADPASQNYSSVSSTIAEWAYVVADAMLAERAKAGGSQ